MTTATDTPSSEVVTPLSKKEVTERTKLEKQINTGIHHIRNWTMAIAVALHQIKDKKLYRDAGTFERYIRSRDWPFERVQAERFASAGRTYLHLQPILGNGPLPDSESQLRPIVALEPDIQTKIWAQVQARHTDDGAKITAALVTQVRDEILGLATSESNDGNPFTDNPFKNLKRWTDTLADAKGLDFRSIDKKQVKKIKAELGELNGIIAELMDDIEKTA